jgi:hypothetical protein
MSQQNRNTSHDVVRGRVASAGEGNEGGNDALRIAENVRTKPTAPTGYVDAEYVPDGSGSERYDGSGSERWPHTGWTEAGDGTNYPGMPNLPTQAQADAEKAKINAERHSTVTL